MVALRTLAMSLAHAGRCVETATAEQPARWRETRSWYVRSQLSWSELARRGEIPSMNAPQVEEVIQAIARCDRELARRSA